MVKKFAIIGGAALLIIIAIVVYIYQQSAYPTNESDMKQFIANGGSPDKLLLTAIDENNVEMAQYAISHGANVNALDSNYSDSAGKSDFENTPLRIALFHGQTCGNVAKVLITHGANVDYVDEAGESNLMFCDYLKKGGGVNRTDSYGNTLLMVAAACDANRTVKLLLKYGADSSLMNSEGESADVMARKYGKTNSAMLILYERGRK